PPRQVQREGVGHVRAEAVAEQGEGLPGGALALPRQVGDEVRHGFGEGVAETRTAAREFHDAHLGHRRERLVPSVVRLCAASRVRDAEQDHGRRSRSRRLRGRMSTQCSLMWSRQLCRSCGGVRACQPGGSSRWAGHREYCSSWLVTTTYRVPSAVSLAVVPGVWVIVCVPYERGPSGSAATGHCQPSGAGEMPC